MRVYEECKNEDLNFLRLENKMRDEPRLQRIVARLSYKMGCSLYSIHTRLRNRKALKWRVETYLIGN